MFRKLNEAKHRKEMAGKIIMHHLQVRAFSFLSVSCIFFEEALPFVRCETQAGAKTAVFSSRQGETLLFI